MEELFMVKELAEKIGLPKLTRHMMRHTVATFLGANGATDMDLMDLGGWKSITMVRRYRKVVDDRLKSVMDIFNQRAEPLKLGQYDSQSASLSPTRDVAIGRGQQWGCCKSTGGGTLEAVLATKPKTTATTTLTNRSLIHEQTLDDAFNEKMLVRLRRYEGTSTAS